MKSKTFFLIHGNMIGLLMGIEGYFIARGSVYAIILGVIIGIYGNILSMKIVKIIKENLFLWMAENMGISMGTNMKKNIDKIKKD
jgi:hypothetical protein